MGMRSMSMSSSLSLLSSSSSPFSLIISLLLLLVTFFSNVGLCAITVYSSSLFFLIIDSTRNYTFSEANDFCTNQFSRTLATVNSLGRQTELASLYNSAGYTAGGIWIGYYNRSPVILLPDFEWLDGSPDDYDNWKIFNPGPGDYCTAMFGPSSDYEWVSFLGAPACTGSNIFGFACNKSPTPPPTHSPTTTAPPTAVPSTTASPTTASPTTASPTTPPPTTPPPPTPPTTKSPTSQPIRVPTTSPIALGPTTPSPITLSQETTTTKESERQTSNENSGGTQWVSGLDNWILYGCAGILLIALVGAILCCGIRARNKNREETAKHLSSSHNDDPRKASQDVINMAVMEVEPIVEPDVRMSEEGKRDSPKKGIPGVNRPFSFTAESSAIPQHNNDDNNNDGNNNDDDNNNNNDNNNDSIPPPPPPPPSDYSQFEIQTPGGPPVSPPPKRALPPIPNGAPHPPTDDDDNDVAADIIKRPSGAWNNRNYENEEEE